VLGILNYYDFALYSFYMTFIFYKNYVVAFYFQYLDYVLIFYKYVNKGKKSWWMTG